MRDILTSLVTNLHVLTIALLVTALGLGVVGSTPDKKSASGERWHVMITSPDTAEAESQPAQPAEQPADRPDSPPEERRTDDQPKQPAPHAYRPHKPDVPWKLGNPL